MLNFSWAFSEDIFKQVNQIVLLSLILTSKEYSESHKYVDIKSDLIIFSYLMIGKNKLSKKI